MSGGFGDLSSLYMLGAFGGGGNMDQQSLMRAMYAQALMRNSSQPAPQTTSPWGAISNAVRPMASAYMASRMMPQRGAGNAPGAFPFSVVPGQTTNLFPGAGMPPMAGGSLGQFGDITQAPYY
jgi:hypothetical protein